MRQIVLNKILKYFLICSVFVLMTVITQIGGIIFLANRILFPWFEKRIDKKILRSATKICSFLIIYIATTFLIVPLIAKPFGRVPLPISEESHLRPLNVMTCILNRNYVKPELRDLMFDVAMKMNEKYPGTALNYLDANFPFINKFPLLPHLSHNDGKKLDMAFCYNESKTGIQTNHVPSLIGYGVCVEPTNGEVDTAAECEEKGYWQYSMLRKIIPQGSKNTFTLNETKTKELILFIAQKEAIEKIFIEPHLKTRMNLIHDKIRFHGCRAVRHDDHLHIQIK